jgi:hypothetical protein
MKLEIVFDVVAEQDDMPVRGNAMVSGDTAVDKEAEDEILRRLDQGDIWAWAFVTVTARLMVDGVEFAEGGYYLGGCNYKNEGAFYRPGGYFDDMKGRAREELFAQLERAKNRGRKAAELLTALSAQGI